MKKTLLKSALMALAGIGLMVGSAMATQLTGGISLTGFTFETDASDLDLATLINFSDAPLNMVVGSGSGSFELVDDYTPGKINDFIFDPFTAYTPLWYFDFNSVRYSFDLTSADITMQNSTSLTIDGFGFLKAMEGTEELYEPTYGTWTFTANEKEGPTSSWSASNAVVPEPATMLLFGTGLAGLAGIARRKK